jgi:hypothetical protein
MIIIIFVAWLGTGLLALATHYFNRRTPGQWITPLIVYEIIGALCGAILLS